MLDNRCTVSILLWLRSEDQPAATCRAARAHNPQSNGKAASSHSDSDGMGSIPASPDARNVPLLLCQERFNDASLSKANGFYLVGFERTTGSRWRGPSHLAPHRSMEGSVSARSAPVVMERLMDASTC